MALVKLLADIGRFRYYAGKGYSGNGGEPGLKSIPYGNDRIGGGDSGEPYVTTNIPKGIGYGQEEASTQALLSTDFLLRGGITAATATADDLKRIGKFMTSPKGLIFIAKQNLLSRSEVKVASGVNGKSPVVTGAPYAGGTINAGIYLPTNTLAQIGVAATGLHFYKQGLSPIPIEISSNSRLVGFLNNLNINSYGNVITPGQESVDNRLVEFYNEKIQVRTDGDPNLLSYSGGPGSILGIGKTNILIASPYQRTGANNIHGLEITNVDKYLAGNYLTSRPNNRTTDSFISLSRFAPILEQYRNRIGDLTLEQENLLTPSIRIGGYTVEPSLYNNNNVYKSGTLEPLPLFYSNETWTPNQSIVRPNLRKNYVYFEPDPLITPATPTQTTEINFRGLTTPNPADTDIRNAVSTLTKHEIDTTADASSKFNVFGRQIIDFRAQLRDKLSQPNYSSVLSNAPDYSLGGNKTVEGRINAGNPGDRKNVLNYDFKVGYDTWNNALDKINAMPIYQSEAVTNDTVKNDLVKFRIAIIDNENPSQKVFIHFRAFLDSFSDAYNAEWNSTKLLGRGENFYTYGGFTRKISMGWTTAAQSKRELIPMYQKLNYLASTLTPDFGSTTGYMKGNLVQLTVGGYLYEQPGIIESLTYTIEQDTPWEIGIDAAGNSDNSVKELAHVVRVTGFSFIPIHTFIPRKQNNIYNGNIGTRNQTISNWGPERYIALETGGHVNYDQPEDLYENNTSYIPWQGPPVEVKPEPTPKDNDNRGGDEGSTGGGGGGDKILPKTFSISTPIQTEKPDSTRVETNLYARTQKSSKFKGYGGGEFGGAGADGTW